MRDIPIAIFCLFLSLSSPLWAGLTPGTYEYGGLGGKSSGRVQVRVSSATYADKPATLVEIVTEMKTPTFTGVDTSVTKDVAYVGASGLQYFKREMIEKGRTDSIEGWPEGTDLIVWIRKGGQRVSLGVPLKSFDMSEFEMELPSSKLARLKLRGAPRARVFYVDALSSLMTVRNVNEHRVVRFNDRDVEIFIVNTNAEGRTVTSWFETKTHRLLKEMGVDRLLIRVE
ncbi:MAG: hypothetical protein LHV69_05855 [Elusimicrobia bacterium]|nr:hypothetical protein [Candidatus Obscuribacterium magneticum]